MFGYVIANLEGLTQAQKDRYKGCYCGLCRVLKQRHGFSGRLTLTYDMTFLVLLLSCLLWLVGCSAEAASEQPLGGLAGCACCPRHRAVVFAQDVEPCAEIVGMAHAVHDAERRERKAAPISATRSGTMRWKKAMRAPSL